jgi:hypothetical protein
MHTPEAASTPCSETPDSEECANPGCDGSGTCSATHIAEPDSTACTDSDGNPCSVAGCQAGVCEQVHACEPDGNPDCEITIGDFVWNDANGDGLQPTESGIPDVDLNLVECSNGEVVEAMTSTNGNGMYSFTVSAVTNLETCAVEERDFLVEVDSSNFAGGAPLDGFEGTLQDVGGDDTIDSDCDPTTNRTMCVAYPAGTTDLTVDCGYTPVGGCLTRTGGFYCTHPTVTDLFLPVTSCGLQLTNVLPETDGSATEDIGVSGQDAKAAGTSMQQLQLIRQCAVAEINFAVSEEAGGSCENEPVGQGMTIGTVMAACCDSLCTSQAAGPTISESGCIELLDEFNNSQDTIAAQPEPFDALGSSTCPVPAGAEGDLSDTCGGQPTYCQAANGNGFVNPRDLGPKQGGGPGGGPKNK